MLKNITKTRETLARLAVVQASDRAKEVFFLVRIAGFTQTSAARILGVGQSSISMSLTLIEEKLKKIQPSEVSIDFDWRWDKLRLECDLADALTREKFLREKDRRMTNRIFWLTELRVPKIQEIKRGAETVR